MGLYRFVRVMGWDGTVSVMGWGSLWGREDGNTNTSGTQRCFQRYRYLPLAYTHKEGNQAKIILVFLSSTVHQACRKPKTENSKQKKAEIEDEKDASKERRTPKFYFHCLSSGHNIYGPNHNRGSAGRAASNNWHSRVRARSFMTSCTDRVAS